MRFTNPSRGWSVIQGGRQRGQAMVYGLFVLAAGLASLFFLFNAGQLVQEKDKLTTTADAVAYSAGVMNARALNFTAYTNRALVANEIAVAQIVSITSWSHFMDNHAQVALSFGCETIYNLPAGMGLPGYTPLCMGLAWGSEAIEAVASKVDAVGDVLIAAAEVAKLGLRGAQIAMMGSLFIERGLVMKEVAAANYRNDGVVKVDPVPLEDDFFLFDKGPIIKLRSGKDRQRLADVVTPAANSDSFIPSRSWSDQRPLIPSCIGTNGSRFDSVNRNGGTGLVGLDQWRAADNVAFVLFHHNKRLKCVSNTTTLASGKQTANAKGGSSDNYDGYKGLPSYFDLSNEALTYTPENKNAAKRDPRVRFSIRVTRDVGQTKTSEARSDVKSAPGGGVYGLNQYKSDAAKKEYAAVSTSEVFFDRPVARGDGKKELANVFNPYWQVHLVETSTGVKSAARLLQGVIF